MYSLEQLNKLDAKAITGASERHQQSVIEDLISTAKQALSTQHSAPTGEVELPVVKTWWQRIGLPRETKPFNEEMRAMTAEIADLRAALRAYGQRAAVAVPVELLKIGELLRTQDEQYTADAMYVVERKSIITGYDPDYSQGADDVVWCIEDSMIFLGDEGFDDLEGAYQEDGTVPENYTRTCYMVRWDFVTAFFTDEAAQAFVERHGHKYDGELRIMVEGEVRNEQWKLLRKWLMSLSAPSQPQQEAVQAEPSEQDKIDAARYRWLTYAGWIDDAIMQEHGIREGISETLDAAIDAAIAMSAAKEQS